MEIIERINEDTYVRLLGGQRLVLESSGLDYRRGLSIELMEGGGYNVEYWYDDPSNIMPSEVKVDGVSIKDDAKLVYLGFHPEE